ncbi:MAG: hypothetical protein U1F43_15700 [Myxococcota bacterium]
MSVLMLAAASLPARADGPLPTTDEPRALRLGAYLDGFAALERHQRVQQGLASLTFGLGLGLSGIGLLSEEDDATPVRLAGFTFIGVGGLSTLFSVIQMASDGDLTDLARSYAARPKDADTVARYERALDKAVDGYRSERRTTAIIVTVTGVAGLVLASAVAIDRGGVGGDTGLAIGVTAGLTGAGIYQLTSYQTAVEDLWDVYRREGALPASAGLSLAPALAPVDGGLVLGASGSF